MAYAKERKRWQVVRFCYNREEPHTFSRHRTKKQASDYLDKIYSSGGNVSDGCGYYIAKIAPRSKRRG